MPWYYPITMPQFVPNQNTPNCTQSKYPNSTQSNAQILPNQNTRIVPNQNSPIVPNQIAPILPNEKCTHRLIKGRPIHSVHWCRLQRERRCAIPEWKTCSLCSFFLIATDYISRNNPVNKLFHYNLLSLIKNKALWIQKLLLHLTWFFHLC